MAQTEEERGGRAEQLVFGDPTVRSSTQTESTPFRAAVSTGCVASSTDRRQHLLVRAPGTAALVLRQMAAVPREAMAVEGTAPHRSTADERVHLGGTTYLTSFSPPTHR